MRHSQGGHTGRYESDCHGLGDLKLSLGLGKSGSRPNSGSESCEHLGNGCC